MEKDINTIYKELCDSFKELSTDDKRVVVVNKIKELSDVLTLVNGVSDIPMFNSEFKTEDEYLCYLHSLVYNLENKLGSLLDKLSNV